MAAGLDVAGQVQRAGGGAAGRPGAGFAQEVDAGPDELAEDVVVVADVFPGGVAGAVLGAVDDAVGIGLVVPRVAVLGIVVADHVDGFGISGLVGHHHAGQGARRRTGAVHGVDLGGQAPRDLADAHRVRRIRHIAAGEGLVELELALVQDRVRIRVVGVVYLVADAPQEDGGMVAVAAHHVGDVALAPLVEEVGRAVHRGRAAVAALDPFLLVELPLVEGLVHHQEAEPVAQVVEDRGLGVVGRADRVGADGLEVHEPALPDFSRDHGSEHAGVVVQAHALDLAVDPVEGESRVGVEGQRADAHRHFGLVKGLLAGGEGHLQRVEIRVVDVPAVRRGDLQVGVLLRGGLGRGLGDHLAGGVAQGEVQPGGGGERTFDRGIHVHHGLFGGQAAGGVADAPQGEMRLAGGHQPDVAVDAGSRIEAGVGDAAVVHADGQDVVSRAVQVGGQVIQEGGVACGAHAEQVSVEVHRGAVVDTLEVDVGLAFGQPAGIEMLAVPADAGGEVAGAGGVVGRERALDGPVVGELDARPPGVVEVRSVRSCDVAEDEGPAVIEQ